MILPDNNTNNTKGINFTYCFVFFKELFVGEIIYLVLVSITIGLNSLNL